MFNRGNYYFKVGDFIIQGGIANYQSSDGRNGTISTFSVPFKKTCFSIVASDVFDGVNSVSASPISTTQFRSWGKNSDGTMVNTTFYWIAIGY